MSFAYLSPIVVDHTKCGSSNSSNFPVLVSVTDNRLKTIANGGHVQSATGYDIRPYSDLGLATAITAFELVFYDAVNGILEMYVKIGTLDTAADVTFYLAYGDASIVTDGSSNTTWDSNFVLVAHLPNGTVLTANDSTSNANNGTNTLATAAAGQIDGGAAFNGTTAHIDMGAGASLNISTLPMTVEFWFKKATSGGSPIILAKHTAGGSGYRITIVSSTTLRFTKFDIADCDVASIIAADTNWHYAAIELSGSGMNYYVDPTSTTPGGTNGNTTNLEASLAAHLQLAYDDNDIVFGAVSLDEVRISKSSRSASWLLASYNNQKSPTTFAPIGTEVPVGGTPVLLPLFQTPQYQALVAQ